MTIPPELAGVRFDQALAVLFPDFSRTQLKRWIEGGRVAIEAGSLRPRDKVTGGERIALVPDLARELPWRPQPVPLAVVFEDDDIIVIDKPAGLVVHPGAGNRDGTLANALLHFDPALAAVPRAGIVHRLDKETTGLLVIARTPPSHKALVEQLEARRVTREYEAIVAGRVTAGGRIDAPIGRHRSQRTRMAITAKGRAALTRFRVIDRFRAHSHLRVTLETGRTHQIRVHMAHRRHPIVGDPQYGGRLAIPANASAELVARLRGFKRQALHAARLALHHPRTGEPVDWEAPPPPDFQSLLLALRNDSCRVS